MRHHAALSELRARRREPIAARTLHLCMHSGAVSLGAPTALFEVANVGDALKVGRDSLIMHAYAPATAVGPASAASLPPSRLRSLAPSNDELPLQKFEAFGMYQTDDCCWTLGS